MLEHQKITDDLDLLLDVLPQHISGRVRDLDDSENLLEIVMDLGRLPKARFVEREAALSDKEITYEDIKAITAAISEFDADNRAGIERTLHRISAIRNRHNDVVGLTCRIGRAVYGTSDIIQDLIESGRQHFDPWTAWGRQDHHPAGSSSDPGRFSACDHC